MLSHRPTSLAPEGQGAAACQAPPPSFTSPAAAASAPGYHQPPPPPASADDLPLRVRDALCAAQWSPANPDPLAPLGLSAAALLAAGVCDARRDADAVVAALVKAGVLDPETHEPVTTRIGPRLTRQVRVLSVPAAKALVRVLFFCEDEVVRLRRYADEQAELEVALGRLRGQRERLEKEEGVATAAFPAEMGGGGGDAAQDADEEQERKEERERLDKMLAKVQFRIKAIELRKKVLPSKRDAEVDLPRYEPAASL